MKNFLDEFVKRRGYTSIHDFANKHNLPKQTLYNISNGVSNPSLKTVKKICSLLNANPIDVFPDFFCLKN